MIHPYVDYEANGGGGGSQPQPSPEPSKPVAGDEVLSKLVRQAVSEELKPIKGEISGLYSRQDKDRNQLREVMDEFRKQKAKGLDDADAQNAAEEAINNRNQQAQRDKLLDALAEKFLNSPSDPARGAVDPASIIDELGLPNAPEVMALKQQRFATESDALKAVAKLAAGLANKPVPNDAQAPALESKKVDLRPEDRSSMKQDYETQMRAAMELPARHKRNKMNEIKSEFRKKGLDVENIGFGI